MILDNLIQILIITLAAYLLVTFVNRGITSSLDKLKLIRNKKYNQRLDTLKPLFNHIITITIYSLSLLMILGLLGFDTAPILTGAGIIGLAFSFGSRSLIKDIIYGILNIIENTYNVGDDICVGEYKGKVKEIKLRNTILKDKDNNTIYISNSDTQKVKVIKKS